MDILITLFNINLFLFYSPYLFKIFFLNLVLVIDYDILMCVVLCVDPVLFHSDMWVFIFMTQFSHKFRYTSTHGHHKMVNTKIRLIIFIVAKDGEALYRQQKQDWEQTVAQIMNLLPNSD